MPDNPNTAEPAKPRRRWFQFRLRTLLVAVMLVGAALGYLAHEHRIVAARNAWLVTHRALAWTESKDPQINSQFGRNSDKAPSKLRQWLFGDHSVCELLLTAEKTGDEAKKDADEAELYFPEAHILADIVSP